VARGTKAAALELTAPVLAPPGRYLRQYDVFRVVTFVCVIAQHSILWEVTSSSVAGWGLVMLLHFTRNAFFFLSAFLALYAQSTRPRSLGQLWYRRVSQILVPYLAWTVIYYTYARLSAPTPDAWGLLGHDLYRGYYQLYFLVVLAQFYVLLPGLLWLIRATRRHHGVLLGTSFTFQVAMTTVSHYAKAPAGWEHSWHAVDTVLIQSRWIIGYEFYVVAGLVAAAHGDELHRSVDRHMRSIPERRGGDRRGDRGVLPGHRISNSQSGPCLGSLPAGGHGVVLRRLRRTDRRTTLWCQRPLGSAT